MINKEKEKSRRPDFYRKEWLDLNGEWEFDFDDEKAGIENKWYRKHDYKKTIQVPYCYQSELSKIHDTGKHPYLWYHRIVTLAGQNVSRRLWLHFGAVDYEASIWINGEFAGNHRGGHTSFSVEITPFVRGGKEFELTVYCQDSYDTAQPRGKQHWNEQTDRCWYTATSGIWQDVWIEYANGTRIEQALITPDIDKMQAEVSIKLSEEIGAGVLAWELQFEETVIGKGVLEVHGARAKFSIPVANRDPIDNLMYLWSPQKPNLYDLSFQLNCNNVDTDKVETYFGMRKIERSGNHILLNHMPFYQKLVLDQGYWKEGLLTPPAKDCYKLDIELAKEMGFNGIRKHQKVESPVFLYYADCLGIVVWEEMPSNYEFCEEGMAALQQEYHEMIVRDYNHPSVITWVPLNESWGVRDILWNKLQQRFAQMLYYMTKAIDDTRLVSTNDGWESVTSDLLGIHDYENDGSVFYEKYKEPEKLLDWTAVGKMIYANGFSYEGEPIIISEFGGIAFEDGKTANWGYNGKAADETEFLTRFGRLYGAIQRLSYVQGCCYTQLTDVEQETNGLLYADRTPKVAMDKIKEIVEKVTI